MALRPDPNSPPPDIIPPNDPPLSGKHLLEDQFEHVAAINRDEDALAALRESFRVARSDALSRNDLARADVELAVVSNEKSKSSSPKIADRCDKQRAALKAERASIEASFEKQTASTPGPAITYLNEFYNSSAVYGSYKRAETVADVREGETLADAMKRQHDAKAKLRAEKKALIAAPLPAADVALNARDFVTHLAAPLDSLIASLRRLSFDERNGFRPRTVVPPKNADGQVDALGLFAALLPDQLANALAKKALEGHKDADAIDEETRAERLEAIESEMVRLDYVSEAIHRLSRRTGENAGPRVAGNNPLAILDLIPA